jgi:hypothetical protein
MSAPHRKRARGMIPSPVSLFVLVTQLLGLLEHLHDGIVCEY